MEPTPRGQRYPSKRARSSARTERWPPKPVVGGSNPPGPATKMRGKTGSLTLLLMYGRAPVFFLFIITFSITSTFPIQTCLHFPFLHIFLTRYMWPFLERRYHLIPKPYPCSSVGTLDNLEYYPRNILHIPDRGNSNGKIM